MEKLKFVSAGQEQPLPLEDILHFCPRLVELVLERCHVQVNEYVEQQKYSSQSLRKFVYIGNNLFSDSNLLLRSISYHMPALIDLEIHPSSLVGSWGFAPRQLSELTKLKQIEKIRKDKH